MHSKNVRPLGTFSGYGASVGITCNYKSDLVPTRALPRQKMILTIDVNRSCTVFSARSPFAHTIMSGKIDAPLPSSYYYEKNDRFANTHSAFKWASASLRTCCSFRGNQLCASIFRKRICGYPFASLNKLVMSSGLCLTLSLQYSDMNKKFQLQPIHSAAFHNVYGYMCCVAVKLLLPTALSRTFAAIVNVMSNKTRATHPLYYAILSG